jgi:hypothetical protein
MQEKKCPIQSLCAQQGKRESTGSKKTETCAQTDNDPSISAWMMLDNPPFIPLSPALYAGCFEKIEQPGEEPWDIRIHNDFVWAFSGSLF